MVVQMECVQIVDGCQASVDTEVDSQVNISGDTEEDTRGERKLVRIKNPIT